MAITNACPQRLGIGALAARTGCKVETIRYYERIGLLPAPARTTGGHRAFGEDHARRLAFIRRARALGFTLDEVRDLLGLAESEPVDCGRVRALTRGHLEEVRRKIADLQRIEASLVALEARCAGETAAECPVLEALGCQDEPVPAR